MFYLIDCCYDHHPSCVVSFFLTWYHYRYHYRGIILFNVVIIIVVAFFLTWYHSFCSYSSFFSLSSDTSSSYGNTSNAFIFSLRNNEGLGPFKSMVKSSRRAYAIYKSLDFGPTFGAGFDMYIARNANSNTNSYSTFGYSYSVPSGVQDRKTILAGTNKFTPDDVEVFYLGWIVSTPMLKTIMNIFIDLTIFVSFSLLFIALFFFSCGSQLQKFLLFSRYITSLADSCLLVRLTVSQVWM